jgi:hypothetical protein
MKTRLVFAIPFLAMLGLAQASDEVSPEMLAQIQAECAGQGADAGLSSDEREVMNWLCVTNLRDYDNSDSD